MQYIVCLFYPLLLFVLLWKCKLFGKGKFNEEYLSFGQMKSVQAFCALGIVLHHIALKTCSPSIAAEFYQDGLEPLLKVGFLFVAVFFFCSGYGLNLSYTTKEKYLDSFFYKRVLPILIPFAESSILFLGFEINTDFDFSGVILLNTYSWYVVALLVCYLIFVISCKFSKKVLRFVFIPLCLVLYCAVCEFFGFGTWCFNSVPAFYVGVLFAEFRNGITAAAKRIYPVLITILTVIFGATFYLSSYYDFGASGCNYLSGYFLVIIFQMISSVAFVLLFVFAGMKVNFGNTILSFVGKLTLEIYLFHVLFVEIFGYCFINPTTGPVLYVRNNTVYAILVFACAIPTAYFLKKANSFLPPLLLKFNNAGLLISEKKVKKGLCIFLALVILITAVYGIGNANDLKEAEAVYSKMLTEEGYQLLDVGDGNQIAASVSGSGEHTIVFFEHSDYPCPTLLYRKMTDILSSDYKTVVLDMPGYGFAGEAKSDRTTENLTFEIHKALELLGIDEPYIIFSRCEGGLLAMNYINLYRDEIEAYISLDMYVPELFPAIAANNMQTMDEFWYSEYSMIRYGYYGMNFLRATGYVSWLWSADSGMFDFIGLELKEKKAMRYVFTEKYYSYALFDAAKRLPNITESIRDFKYPSDLPVYMFVGTASNEGFMKDYGIDWIGIHDNLISNADIQKTELINGSNVAVAISADDMSKMIKEFVGTL
ncbi:MAG: acyltransferase family protein [Clostridia bacterium]|nr:acyltransferase family protein [Clostridia bacterium]